jgi:endonuclease-3
MNKKIITEIFKRFEQALPEPKTELKFTNPYTLLVAVILSAQATDVGVNKATPALFEEADNPKDMVALGEEKLRDYIKTIGLFNGKAKNIIKMSQMLLDDFGGKVPENRDDLVKLAGVGRKTANVILNCTFNQPTMAVDTHVYRVANRIGFVNTKTPDATEIALLKIIPKEYLFHAHHWLILHGRYTCKARKPDCTNCIINDLCEFKEKIT